MRFSEPWWLVALLLLVPIVWLYRHKKIRPALPYPSLGILGSIPPSPWLWARHLPMMARCLGIALLVFAMARPQGEQERGQKTTEGLDIVLVIDTSRSMEARDFVIGNERPTRLTVIKKVISEFIDNRPDDRLGMVVFGTEAFTQAPLTLDHTILQKFLERIQIGMVGDATAIGDGLATAVNRLKDLEAKSRVVVLLTDGSNTAGRVDPLAAGQAAKALGVRVYTVGVGSEGAVPVVVGNQVQTQKADIDEDLLRKISTETGGQYFRATDTETLVKIYQTIDQLEKSKVRVDSFERREERYTAWVTAALICTLFELGFALTRFRSIP